MDGGPDWKQGGMRISGKPTEREVAAFKRVGGAEHLGKKDWQFPSSVLGGQKSRLGSLG